MPDIVIIPQRGTSNNPSMHFTGSALANIRMEVLPSGSISFIGTSGSLFNVTDNLLGSLMSVGDVSGLPILEVFSDDRVVMGRYGKNTVYVSGTNVGIGKVPANAVFDVSGSAAISGSAVVTGSLTANGRVTFNNGGTGGNGTLTVAGDITTYRSSTEGIIYFGSSQTKYLYFDGTGYYLWNGNVNITSTYALAFSAYGGGWYMQDTTWIRSVNSKSVWLDSGVYGAQGGLTLGYGGGSPPSAGAIISGCVGIGTSSPSYPLDVAGATRVQGTFSALNCFFVNNGYIGINNNQSTYGFQLSAGSTNANAKIDGNLYVGSNLGIGTTSPLQLVHINGSILLDGTSNGYTVNATRGIGYGSNGGAVSVDGFSGMDIQSVNAPAPNNGNYSQNLRFFCHHYGTGTGGTPRMFIQYNGNVGIGTTTPTAKLEVSGDVMADNVLNPFLLMGA